MTKSMLPNKLPVELRKLRNSAVSEMANMITGNSVQSTGIPLLKNIPATIESTDESPSDITHLTGS